MKEIEMSLENICVSLETAKKLVEAGIVLESVFSWFFNKNALYSTFPMLKFTNDNRARWSSYPAPTAEELWKLLPFCIGETPTSSLTPFMQTIILNTIVYRDSERKNDSVKWMVVVKDTLCEAMSEMFFWLKENGYLKGA
jgi:hypothetical protein